MAKAKKATVTEIGPEPTNGGQATIEIGFPYVAHLRLRGTADILFHRWNSEAVYEKGKAAKGSAAKKTDNLESYVYRDDNENLCVPGEYVRGALLNAAKYKQDPRSPRKSAMDLFKAGVIALTPLATLGVREWDYEHKCRVQVQRNGITRSRPAIKAGYEFDVDLLVNLPEYISPDLLHAVMVDAGRLVGIADFRPTYGRFSVISFTVSQPE